MIIYYSYTTYHDIVINQKKGDKMVLTDKIISATNADMLNEYGLEVSLSSVDNETKKLYYTAIETRRQEVELSKGAVINCDLSLVEQEGYDYELGA